jgi:hypothetical protein
MKSPRLLALALLALPLSSHAAKPEVLPLTYVDGQPKPYTALLTIDQAKKIIQVQVLNDICHKLTARPDQITCDAMPLPVVRLEAKLEKITAEGGARIYTGKSDDRVRDGILTEITVREHGRTQRDGILPFELTVKAHTFNPWTDESTDYYFAR